MQELSLITPKLLPAPAHLRAPQRPNKRRKLNLRQPEIQARTAPFSSQPRLPFPRKTNIQKRTGSKQNKNPSNFQPALRNKNQKKNISGKDKKINQRKPVQQTPFDKKISVKDLESKIKFLESRKSNRKGKRPLPPNKERQTNGPQGMLTAQAKKIGQKLAKVQLGGRPILSIIPKPSSLLDFMNVPGRNVQNKRKNYRPPIQQKGKPLISSKPAKQSGGKPNSRGTNSRNPNGKTKPGRKANNKNGRRPNSRPKTGTHLRRRKYPKKRPRYPLRKQRPFKRENNKPKSASTQPKTSSIDSYGAPQAPVVDVDSYGSPNAPAISNQDSYGAPQAPAVSDSYGAPQAPLYGSNTKEKGSPPPPPPPPPSDTGYQSDLISSFRPASEEEPIPFPTPDISQSSNTGFEGQFQDNFDASVASFADGISDFSGYSDDEPVQTYNGYFTEDRTSYEQSEEENDNIKPFSNYFDGFDKSDDPTQSPNNVFSAKSDKIRYYDENGNLINPQKFKPIDYKPDYFETIGTTTNRRVFDTESKNRNRNKNLGSTNKEDDDFILYGDINPRRKSQSKSRISITNPVSEPTPSKSNVETISGSNFENPEPERIKEPSPTTDKPYSSIRYEGKSPF